MKDFEIESCQDVLEHSVVFRGLDAFALLQVMKAGLLLSAPAGDFVIFEQMPGGPGLYVVIEGKVEILLPPDGAGRTAPVHLNTLEPGECFGEYSLLDGKKTSAAAKAAVPAKIFFLPRGQFLKVIESDPVIGSVIYRNLLLFLIERLREKDQSLDIMVVR